MKVKHFLSGATLLSAALLLNAPLSAAVESDVVGYTTITTNPGFNMLGVTFVGLNETEEVSFDALVDGEFRDGDQIQVYSVEEGYTVYNFSNQAWRVGREPASNYPVKAGTGFWLSTPERSVEVTLKGAVRQGDYLFKTVKGTQMFAAGFPIDISLSNGDKNVAWTGFQNGDEIQWLDENGYEVSIYRDGGWRDGRAPSSKVIPAGASVWLTTSTDTATVLVKNPLK